jgi:hypothetical protein
MHGEQRHRGGGTPAHAPKTAVGSTGLFKKIKIFSIIKPSEFGFEVQGCR